MKGLTVLLGVLATIMLVIYATGDPVSQQYLKQSMYLGNTVFVEDANTATVNGVNVEVAHRGFTNMDKFEVGDIVTMSEGEGNNTTSKQYLILSHEIGGIFGKATPVLTPNEEQTIAVGEDATLYGTHITYVGNVTTRDGERQHVYEVDGLSVMVGASTYSYIQTDEQGNGLVLKQDATSGDLNVGNVSKPFDISTKDFSKLIVMIGASGLIGYWALYYDKRKVYGRME